MPATPASGDEGKLQTLWAGSIYGVRSRRGLVELAHQDEEGKVTWKTQVHVGEARSFALSILEAAEAAETDSVLVTFFTTRLGLDLPQVVAILGDFRKLRDELSR
jgi:hypothetical protein